MEPKDPATQNLEVVAPTPQGLTPMRGA